MDGTNGFGGVEVWRGGVNAWECDDMGHMNSRYYVAHCTEAASVLFALAGLPRYCRYRLGTMHIRFHREAPAGTPLQIQAGFVRVGENDADVLFLMLHEDGRLAASFRVTVFATDPNGGSINWPEAFRTNLGAFSIATPEEALPRSVPDGAAIPAMPDLAARLRISLGTIKPAEGDEVGRMVAHKFLGAVSDGIRRLTAPLRDIVCEHAELRPERAGGALLEFRIVHLAWPMVGDSFEVRSAFRGADRRTFLLEHWMVDPISGRPWGYMESIAGVFDLGRRKIVGITDAAHEALKPLVAAA